MRRGLLKGRCFQRDTLLVLGFMTKFVVDSTVKYLNIANDSSQI